MSENQIELKEKIGSNWGIYKKLMPEIANLHDAFHGEVYNDGEVSGKNKRLMAVVGALVSGCRACILYQTEKALEDGVTVGEILESCAVAVSLGGTMASGETARVIALLKELGKID